MFPKKKNVSSVDLDSFCTTAIGFWSKDDGTDENVHTIIFENLRLEIELC